MKSNKLSQLVLSLQMLKKMFSDKKASKWPKIAMIAALLYLLIPTDFIPDIVPILGLLDDLGLLIAAIATVLNALKKYKKSEGLEE